MSDAVRFRSTPEPTLLVIVLVLATGALASSCERDVSVADAGTAATSGGISGPSGSPGAAGAAGMSNAAGSSSGSGAGGSAGEAGRAGSTAVDGDAGSASPSSLADGVDQAGASGASFVTDIEVLGSLNAIELPAVGSEGVSLAQFPDAEHAVALHVDWSGNAGIRHENSRAYYVYTAATAQRHLALLYTVATHGIHADGSPDELSGTPSTYKEFLASNDRGFAWVDYPERMQGGPIFGGTALGTVVFQPHAGDRTTLTDALRYRARIDLSDTHVAFVEYANTTPGTVGQIVVQPIAGGAAVVAAPSAHHQDRPAIDGDWVVWEEYLGGTDAIIRARNLSTGEVRDLSASTGFRTNPDVRGTRVLWEDQRSGDGDVYFTELDGDDGERIAVSGAGHSAATRLTADGLVWIETANDRMGLLRARWAP